MIKLYSIPTGNFHLDGGAMFGVVPKTIWEKQVPANEKNLCNWAMRCLLVENKVNNRVVLIDTGIGNKQSEKFFSYYDLNGEDSLLKSIEKIGFSVNQITDVLLTHLHFDHVGGAVFEEAGEYFPTFPNATYWVHQDQWLHAHNPNPRERASFLLENFDPLNDAGVLSFVSAGELLADCIEINVFNGHTLGMIVPIIHNEQQKIVYGADLIPSSAHIPVNYVMGYDIQPLITMDEKAKILNDIVSQNMLLFYEHDAICELSSVIKNEKGQFAKGTQFSLTDLTI